MKKLLLLLLTCFYISISLAQGNGGDKPATPVLAYGVSNSPFDSMFIMSDRYQGIIGMPHWLSLQEMRNILSSGSNGGDGIYGGSGRLSETNTVVNGFNSLKLNNLTFDSINVYEINAGRINLNGGLFFGSSGNSFKMTGSDGLNGQVLSYDAVGDSTKWTTLSRNTSEYYSYSDTVAFSGFRNWEALINDTLFLISQTGLLYSYKVEKSSLRSIDTVQMPFNSLGTRTISSVNNQLWISGSESKTYIVNSSSSVIDSLQTGTLGLFHPYSEGKYLFAKDSAAQKANLFIVDIDTYEVDTLTYAISMRTEATDIVVSDRHFVITDADGATAYPARLYNKNTNSLVKEFADDSFEGAGLFEDTLYLRWRDALFTYSIADDVFVDTLYGLGSSSGPGSPTLYVTDHYIYANNKDVGFTVLDRSSKEIIYQSSLSRQDARRLIWSENGLIGVNNRDFPEFSILRLPVIKKQRFDGDFANFQYTNSEVINTNRANIKSLNIPDESISIEKITPLPLSSSSQEVRSETGTTDGSGDLTVTHNLGSNQIVITATATGTIFYHVQIHSKTSNNFKIRFFDASGSTVTSTAVTADWIAKKL